MERNFQLERHLIQVAAQAAGLAHDCGFASFRDTSPPSITSWDAESDTRRYLAAARDTLVMSLCDSYTLVVSGDPDASETHTRRMRALTGLIEAWRGLHGG